MAASINRIAVVVVQLTDTLKKVSSAFVASFKRGEIRGFEVSLSCPSSGTHQKRVDTDGLLKSDECELEELLPGLDVCRKGEWQKKPSGTEHERSPNPLTQNIHLQSS